jgi:hypothetical protein|tara:strand:+ start:15810 stop:16007 length:198 start_codon:yes stop_codon:yes gene_type:complete
MINTMKNTSAAIAVALSIIICTLIGFYAGMQSVLENSFSEGVKYGNESCYALVDYALGYKERLSK